MALMKTLILALCIGHSAVLELPPRRRARLFSYMWCWVLLGHFPSLRPVVDALGSRGVLFKGWCQSSRQRRARSAHPQPCPIHAWIALLSNAEHSMLAKSTQKYEQSKEKETQVHRAIKEPSEATRSVKTVHSPAVLLELPPRRRSSCSERL